MPRKRCDKGECLRFDLEAKIERLCAALDQIKVTCDGNKAATCDHGMALKFVGEVATHTLSRI